MAKFITQPMVMKYQGMSSTNTNYWWMTCKNMEIEPNNLYLGDCYELIKEIPDKSIDLIYTDIPYAFVGNGVNGGGCQHDCSYCYAKSLLSFRGLWDNEHPAVAPIDKIENVIKKLPKGSVVRLGGMTDCFQPCELEYRITYETIKLLNKYGIGYLIVTKSHLVANDEYMAIYDKRLAHFQITTTTLDDELSVKYEKASVPSKRIEAILKLQNAGFDVAIRLSPLMEEYMDIDKLNTLGINKAIVEFFKS